MQPDARVRFLVIATVEVPTDAVPAETEIEHDAREALTSAGYFVVRADAGRILSAEDERRIQEFDEKFVPGCDTEGL